MTYYGYDFTERNSGGLGAIIHDVMNAVKYAEDNEFTFALTIEGYEIPRLNGSYDDVDIPNKNWHSYFNSFKKVNRSKCFEVWPNIIHNTRYSHGDIQQYSNLIKDKVCIFREDIRHDIQKLVDESNFNADTDIVLHVRMTDKITENQQLLPIDKYIEECEYALKQLNNKHNRIYICTDNKYIITDIKNHFDKINVEVVCDYSESYEPLQLLRVGNMLSKSKAQAETMVALKKLFIMKSAKYLIGARMSYFFRIGELLGYPNVAINLQDNDAFGIAPYSAVKYKIRPYLNKTIQNFINKNAITSTNILKYNQIYHKDNIVTIHDFVSHEVLTNIKHEIENYKWWTYATIPNENEWTVKYSSISIPECAIKECKRSLANKLFTYRFQRCLGNHYDTCTCISCKINDTVRSFPFTDTVCKIIGCRNVIPGETFLSKYNQGDFLSLHTDVKKGDIAVTISFSYDWDPCFGGILHFCDQDKNIYKSIVPKLGNINIFKLDPNNGIYHFVSTVNVDKKRYTLVAWYWIID